jgi:DNA-binding NarL/FixJ family response regulator
MKTGVAVSIVSPYPITSEGFSSMLKGYAVKMRCYSSPMEFLNSYLGHDHKTDLVIIDSTIGISIVEMLSWELCQKWPDIKILVVAAETDIFTSKSFLYSGVKGIINKGASRNEILSAVSSVLGNGRYFSPGMQYKILQGIVSQQKYQQMLKNDYNLSEREVMIIRLVCLQKTSKEIGELVSLSQRTVEGMRARILRKLGLENGVGLVIFGLKHNLFHIGEGKRQNDALILAN